jgi:hypothetical protein
MRSKAVGQVTSDEATLRRWETEQALLGLARDTPRSAFAAGGLAAVAVAPTVRIVVLPGDPAAVALPAQDPQAVIPPVISIPDCGQLPGADTVRGTSSGYVRFPDPGRGRPWPRFGAVHWHGGIDFYLGEAGGRDASTAHDLPRLIWLRRTVAWTWGAFSFQGKIVRRYEVAGPFRAIVGVASTAAAGLADLGTGWAEPGGPGAPTAPAAIDQQVLLTQDLAQWPDAAGIKDLALRFGARLDLAFGGPGDRHLDKAGPDAGEFRVPRF